jgi:prepilin-type processing-associated H-X9-DG protein
MGCDCNTVRTTATGTAAGWPAPNPGTFNPARDRDDLDAWEFMMGFGSAHPAGINMVFADGSVHHVKYGIDMQVFNALGNMNDGTNLETTSTDW